MSVSGFLQSTADKTDIVGRAAAAPGLADDNRQMIGVIISGKDGVHNLSDNDQRRLAGIIVYIFKPHVHGLTVVVRKHFDLVSCGSESGLQKFEMDR